MGDITMTDTESGKEHRHRVERYRVLARETTDPLASGLLRDIVSELEADLKELAEDAWWSPADYFLCPSSVDATGTPLPARLNSLLSKLPTLWSQLRPVRVGEEVGAERP